MASEPIEIRFPIAGINTRRDLIDQPPLTAYDALNVLSDGPITQRERGGSRPGSAKFFAAELGDGAPVRLLNTLRYFNAGVSTTISLASSNGILYRESSGNWSAVSSSCTLASDRQLSSVDFYGRLLIADNGPLLANATDGVIGGAGNNELTSATVGDFAADGVNDDDYAIAITEHAAINAVQTITLNGSPTGGEWFVRDDDSAVNSTAEDGTDIAYNAAASVVEDALERVYGAGNVAVSGSAGGPYAVTFQGDLAGQAMTLMSAEDDYLTGGTPSITVAHTTRGASIYQHAGTYNITTVATTTVTISHALQALTGVKFYITRCPKVYDPVANTLAKYLQDDYTIDEANDLGDEELEGKPKGAIPLGRTIITQFSNRVFFAGGPISPSFYECCRQDGSRNEHDWDYSQDDTGRAMSGSSEETARVGEPITALVPHQNSCMIVACNSSLWVQRGDITAGGLVNISQSIGVIDKAAWATTPEGIFFFVSLDGVYLMDNPCGSTPQSVSRLFMPKELRNIDVADYAVSLCYNLSLRVLEIWVTDLDGTEPTTHWMVDCRLSVHGDSPSSAFWKIELASEDYEPFCVHERRDTFDEYPNALLGCRDGYVRRFREDLSQDDGDNFDSWVLFRLPLSADPSKFNRINELRTILPEDSGPIDVTFYTGDSDDEALNDTDPATFDWAETGQSVSVYVRKRGTVAYIKLENADTNARWEFSRAWLTLLPGGKVRP